jgi:hypothetical protein
LCCNRALSFKPLRHCFSKSKTNIFFFPSSGKRDVHPSVPWDMSLDHTHGPAFKESKCVCHGTCHWITRMVPPSSRAKVSAMGHVIGSHAWSRLQAEQRCETQWDMSLDHTHGTAFKQSKGVKLNGTGELKKKNVYIKLAKAVSMRCEENLRGRSEYPITNGSCKNPIGKRVCNSGWKTAILTPTPQNPWRRMSTAQGVAAVGTLAWPQLSMDKEGSKSSSISPVVACVCACACVCVRVCGCMCVLAVVSPDVACVCVCVWFHVCASSSVT